MNAKVLIQNPGKSNVIREIMTKFNYGLSDIIKNTFPGDRDTKRKEYIYKHIIWIVESNRFNTIYIRNNVSEPCKKRIQYEQARSFNINVAYKDPLTFNYWKFPPKTFDIIISPNPVRLEMLKEEGTIINQSVYLY